MKRASGKPSAEAIRRAEEGLAEEHRALGQLVGRLASVEALSELVPLLDELHPKLHSHFAHEEYPGGLYDTLGATASTYRDQVRELVDDHFRILAKVRELRGRAGEGDPETAAALIGEARAIIPWLQRHEGREHAIAEQAHRAIEP